MTPASEVDALLAREQAAQPLPIGSEYWAAQAPEAVIGELVKKEKGYFEAARRRGFSSIWKIMYAQHYGLDPEGLGTWATQQIGIEGDYGELLRFRVNTTRSYVRQLVTLALGTRPAFECSATNSDYDSIGQAEIADSIIDYSYNAAYGEHKERLAVEKGVLFGSSWTWVNWDPNGGEWTKVPVKQPMPDGTSVDAVDPMTGQPVTRRVRSGKLVMKALAPWDIFQEATVEDSTDHLWRCVRERRSKWEVAGRFPEKREAILALDNRDEYAIDALFGFDKQAQHDEEIVVKHFYHPPSAALEGTPYENGRYIVYAGDEALQDLPMPVPIIPCIEFCPARYIGTSFGYADAWDLCSVNQMEDQLTSDVASNLSTFGRQIVSVEEGSLVDPDLIAGGMRVLTRRAGTQVPEAVQLAAVPESSKWFLEHLRKVYQGLSNLNSVARGDPDHNISSGTMAALFHSIAIENNSDLQTAVDDMRERVANLMLDILKRYAEHPMIMKIAGVDERPYIETFKRDDLTNIPGVVVKTSNPMMRTQAGRLELAQMMLNIPNAISDPGQLVEVVVSGQIKPLYDAPRKLRMHIKREDEALQEGPPVEMYQEPPMPPLPDGTVLPPPPPRPRVPDVPVSDIDNHVLHIRQHDALRASRRWLTDEPFRQAVLAHIADHRHVWKTTDPAWLQAMGLPQWPMMAPPMPPPEQDQGPDGKPVGGNGKAPDAVKPTDQPKQVDERLGTNLPKPARSPTQAPAPG